MMYDTNITRKDVAKFIFFPGIVPRVTKLFGGGFGYLPFYIAMMFRTLRILPPTHPYAQPYNIGNFSILQVMRAAADNIRFDRANIDKVTIFFVVLGGIVLLFLQLVLCIVAMLANPAFAYNGPAGGPTSTEDFFSNPNAEEDLAFRLLDLVFGLPNIFYSKDMGAEPFHTALHALFEFYSYGVLLVGALVIVYLATTIILETAQTGIPFGERFNKAWAPIRLILFFGLLLPTASGINLAQYIVLQSAKMGSNVATNAWRTFDAATKNTPYLGQSSQLIGDPNPPDLDSFVSFMQLAKVCSWAEGRINGRDIQPYAVFNDTKDTGAAIKGTSILIGNTNPPPYKTFSKHADGGTIFIRFGEKDEDIHAGETGAVYPYCGELMLTIVDHAQPGATLMQQAYLELVSCMWYGSEYAADSAPTLGTQPNCRNTLSRARAKAYTSRYSVVEPRQPFPDMTLTEMGNARINETWYAAQDLRKAATNARDKQIEEGDWINEPALEKGWAGAGIWFNKIAEQNGALTAAVFAKPEIHLMPDVMEYVRRVKLAENKNTSQEEMFVPTLSSGQMIDFEEPQQRDVLLVLNQLFAYWGSDHTTYFLKSIPETHTVGVTNNIVIDLMNAFLGTRGLFDMCRNADVHPLAQLTTLGKGLIEHSIRGFALAAGTGVAGGILALLQQADFAGVMFSATSFFMGFAGLGLMIGFLLFYVVPFLPFIYFFFAVMTWVKGIFEAMVGMPLWALAHLSIEGDGMPGRAAMNGYYHVLEIFLRPVCILVGFLGGIVIFAAMVKVMNMIFYLVISNLTGHYVGEATGCFAPPAGAEATAGSSAYPTEDMFAGGAIDEFFYTVMYAILVFIFALPCFKLVDLIPDTIMRWLGAGITPFGAQDGDPSEGLMTNVSAGAGLVGGKLQSGFGKAFSMFGIR